MELELEARRDAEVRARAAQAPEQLRLLVRARPHEPPVGGHELDRAKAVDRQAELALEPADPAAEGQPGDAGMTDDADRADEAVLLGSDVELAEQRSPTRPGAALSQGRRSRSFMRPRSMTMPPSVVECPTAL